MMKQSIYFAVLLANFLKCLISCPYFENMEPVFAICLSCRALGLSLCTSVLNVQEEK